MTAYVVCDPAQRSYADRLVALCSAEIRRQLEEAGREEVRDSDVPALSPWPGIASLPLSSEIEPMAMVLLVLPPRGFSEAESARVRAFLAEAGAELRLLPVAAPGVKPVPPAPLDAYVSARIDPDDPASVKQLATWLLIHFFLRASAEVKSVFISYRAIDGKFASARLVEGLKWRNFTVFRDENLDDDMQKSLRWGTKAQEELSRRINQHGALLLVDTPEAVKSPWVRIEVDTAHARLKPIFPVVLHPRGMTYDQVGRGGRFPTNRESQVGISCPYDSLDEAGVREAISEEFLDRLVLGLGEHLARHLYVMRYLIRASEEQFRRLGFRFQAVDGDRLYLAWTDRDHSLTPGLRFRFLVKCSPYKALVQDDVSEMGRLLKSHPDYCQYGLLIEPPPGYGFNVFRDELLADQGGHLLILQADEIREIAGRILALEAAT